MQRRGRKKNRLELIGCEQYQFLLTFLPANRFVHCNICPAPPFVLIGSNEYFPADLLVAPTQDLRKKESPAPKDTEMAGEGEEEQDSEEEEEEEEEKAGGRRQKKPPPKRAAAKYDILTSFRGGTADVSS